MAQGDITWFKDGLLAVGKKLVDLNGDTIKCALVKSAANGGIDPAASTANPCWGAGGSTNLSSSEVTPGGNYSAGGPSIGTHTFANSGAAGTTPVLSASATLQIAQHASNPTNARWGILYSDTATAKNALGFVDLGSDRNLTTGPFTIDWGDSPVTNSILQIA